MIKLKIGPQQKKLLPPNNPQGLGPNEHPYQEESNPISSQPPSQSLPQQSEADSQPSSTDAPEHFDALFDNPEIQAGPMPGETPAPGILGKDEFFLVFIGGFKVAAIVTHLKSVEVNQDDRTARAACDAIYDTVNEIPALRFLLEPQGKWMGRVMAIGMFAVPMALNVQAELSARAPKKPAQPGPAQGEVHIPDFDMTGGK